MDFILLAGRERSSGTAPFPRLKRELAGQLARCPSPVTVNWIVDQQFGEPMFENLTDKLQRAFKTLRGQGTLTEENIAEALREIRVALLEADVNLNVVKDLIEQIRVKAVGTEVLTALSPSEQVIKIVRDELITLLGKDTARFKFSSQPPTVILMAGLQGSGKTTTAGKLAAWLKKGGHRPMLVSVDVYRPAAREQLKVVAKQVEARLYEGDEKGEPAGSKLVERLAGEARREARNMGCDTLIVDTAGRLHVDEELRSSSWPTP
jgi:signal recognition particle subunit SRP54